MFKVSFKSVQRVQKGCFMGVSIVIVLLKSSQLPEHMEGLFGMYALRRMEIGDFRLKTTLYERPSLIEDDL